jgi:hypothetical protein
MFSGNATLHGHVCWSLSCEDISKST